MNENIEKLEIATLDLDEKYFINDAKIEFNFKDKYIEKIFNFLKAYDDGANDDSGFGYNFSNLFNIYIDNLSDGELDFIETFANIYYPIDYHFKGQNSIILILDEPDKSFHPEWSSIFIESLIELVNLINKKNKLKFQILISTHSPFMLSDIPKEYINCIDIQDGKRIVDKSSVGFASNYYDIIKNSFFLNSPIGKFAQNKINKWIEEINKTTNLDDLNNIQTQIEVIDDKYIKMMLEKQIDKKKKEFTSKNDLLKEKEILMRRLNEIKKELGE